ncbi:hypothetical protein Pan44_54210 [Caulifigura coniformis]|uniref:HEAT repeat domain-containing protein n=1 Tax=Caulifigura coniformis TaxID=2527983 RepID=A0A517SMK3_9PLAN|nr:hypothetical protein [Caulifigura coniformis]QDT57353.1 hypothetical protein Pan44_54210 [Caulifigura coniformis]
MLRLIAAICVFGVGAAIAADPPKDSAAPASKTAGSTARFTVRDVNLYVMSSYGNSLNHRDLFKSTLPGFVGARRATAERKQLNDPSPAGLITFEGEPADNVDVLLEFTNGRFFGNWPPCPQKSKRLLWVKSKLTKEPADTPARLAENHWMTFLRNSDRLWSAAGQKSERFLLYDVELPLPAPVKVTLAEGGHGLANTSHFALHDVTVYKPEAGQWLVGTLPQLEAAPKKEKPAKDDKEKKKPDPESVFDKEEAPKDGKDKPAQAPAPAKTDDEKKPEATKDKDTPAAAAPASAAAPTPAGAPAGAAVPVATPAGAPMPAADGKPAEGEKKPDDAKVVTVPSSKEPQSKEAILATWSAHLKDLGLGPVEIEYLSKQIAGQALRTDSATIVFRLDPDQLEELFPLEVTPAPQKQIRVALVVLLDSDPDVTKRVEELVKKLGDPSYAEREAAMEALRKLGPAAKQKVQEAVNDKDAEISFRAEQLVEVLNDPTGAQPRPNE